MVCIAPRNPVGKVVRHPSGFPSHHRVALSINHVRSSLVERAWLKCLDQDSKGLSLAHALAFPDSGVLNSTVLV